MLILYHIFAIRNSVFGVIFKNKEYYTKEFLYSFLLFFSTGHRYCLSMSPRCSRVTPAIASAVSDGYRHRWSRDVIL